MLLGKFLIAVVRGDLLAVLHSLQRILCKFIDIHSIPSLLEQIRRSKFYGSVLETHLFVFY